MAGISSVRFSPHSAKDPDRQRFIRVGGRGEHDLSYYQILSSKTDNLNLKLVCRHSKIPYVRVGSQIQCLDWSPVDEDLIAVGQSSGEALLLHPSDDKIPATLLGVKHQRSCNDISFNSSGSLLATGLDKVRNDFCLNIWDIKERIAQPPHELPRPSRQLASSEAILSVKFTRDNPNTLIAGVAYRYLKVFDLRESPGNPAISVHTRRVYGITLDLDPNYFASHAEDGTVAVWDRRYARSNPSCDPVLQFNRPTADEAHRPGISTISSLRYSPYRQGLFAVLGNGGGLRVYETAKISEHESLHPSTSMAMLNGENTIVEVHKPSGVAVGWRNSAASLLEAGRAYGGTSTSASSMKGGVDTYETLLVHRMTDLIQPLRNTKGAPDKRVASFDWVGDQRSGPPKILVACQDGSMSIMNCPGPVPSIAWASRNQFTITHDKDLAIMPAPNPTFPLDLPRSGKKECSEADYFEDGDRSHFSSGSPDQRLGILEKRRLERSNSIVRPEDFFREPAEVLKNDISVTMRRRVEAGYQMDCAKNARIASDEKNRFLQDGRLEDMWVWMDGARECANNNGMMSGLLDLSFLGVKAIWRSGKDDTPKARMITEFVARKSDWTATIAHINRNSGRKPFRNCKTEFPEQRRLCLAICGWNYDADELEAELQKLEANSEHSKAAGWALFIDRDIDRAVKCLQKGGQQMKLMSAAIAGYYAERNSPDSHSPWKVLASEMATELDDPYLRAMFAYVSNSEWEDVLDQIGLPLRERVGIALRWLDDQQLTNFLDSTTKTVIAEGDLDGIMLTGVTETAIELLQVYINKTADVQTAALVASFACPKYFKDERVEYWIDSYRGLLNSWSLFHARAKLDVARGKASRDRTGSMSLEAPQKQVYVRCANCDKSIAQSSVRNKKLPPNASRTPKLTACPHCKKSLPRCAVCLLYLGTVYFRPGEKAEEPEKEYDRWFNFCLSCNHGMHAGHAKEWFEKHRVCPVPECECFCSM